jgi:hypothetical protein
MSEGAASSEGVVQSRARSWTSVQGLLGGTGTVGLALIVATAISELPLQGSGVLYLAILAIPFIAALAAFGQIRAGHQAQRWWFGVTAGFLGLVAAFLTGGVPIFLPLSFVIRSFDVYFVLLFLTNLTYVVLAVAGVWTLVAHLRDRKPPKDAIVGTPSSGTFFDAEGNQVIPAYIVQTSSTAVVAFVLVWFVSPIGLVLGYVALNEIRNSQGTKTGEGLARAAIIIGWLWIALAAALVVAVLTL